MWNSSFLSAYFWIITTHIERYSPGCFCLDEEKKILHVVFFTANAQIPLIITKLAHSTPSCNYVPMLVHIYRRALVLGI